MYIVLAIILFGIYPAYKKWAWKKALEEEEAWKLAHGYNMDVQCEVFNSLIGVHGDDFKAKWKEVFGTECDRPMSGKEYIETTRWVLIYEMLRQRGCKWFNPGIAMAEYPEYREMVRKRKKKFHLN